VNLPTIAWTAADWIALRKPAGIPVFPPHADPTGDCLLRRLIVEAPRQAEIDWPAGFSGGLAHRLDTSTSGLVLAARSESALREIRAAFSSRALNKRYRFVSARAVPWDHHTVTHRLAHDRRRRSRMTYERGASTPHRGRWHDATTSLRRMGSTSDGLAIWEATMRTGVMHQIRVHAASVGLALVGDRLYGGGTPHPATPNGVDFLLHHCGFIGPDLDPPDQPVPAWWPSQVQDADGV
jgi:23S rRNA pseudouridine1911/1915/1917 synthase